jgi:hypothetical protein
LTGDRPVWFWPPFFNPSGSIKKCGIIENYHGNQQLAKDARWKSTSYAFIAVNQRLALEPVAIG